MGSCLRINLMRSQMLHLLTDSLCTYLPHGGSNNSRHKSTIKNSTGRGNLKNNMKCPGIFGHLERRPPTSKLREVIP